MAAAVDQILLLPRFSAFAGSGPFHLAAFNVSAYDKADIVSWRGNGIGSPPAGGSLSIERSVDLSIWTPFVGPFYPPNPDEQLSTQIMLSEDWLRVVVAGDAGAYMTYWMTGRFYRRGISAD